MSYPKASSASAWAIVIIAGLMVAIFLLFLYRFMLSPLRGRRSIRGRLKTIGACSGLRLRH
jgi:branched-subunit amino acid ABC-type transport system permease component